MKTLKQIIKPRKTLRAQARQLLKLYEDPERWATVELFRGADNHRTDPDNACKCCVLGGALLVQGLPATGTDRDYHTAKTSLLGKALFRQARTSGYDKVWAMNDRGGLDTVRAALKEIVGDSLRTSPHTER